MGPLLLAALLQAPDLVVARDGRRFEGRAVDLGPTLEIEGPDGRLTRLFRYEVARVEPGPDFPRCPEVVPLPPDALDKADYDFASYRHVLLALPKRGGKMLAVDVRTGRRLWEHEPSDLLVPPLVAGSTVYLLQARKEADPTRKLKFDGVARPKEVQKILARALSLESGEARWEIRLDNNDRKDVYWTVAGNPAPTLHVLPDRVALRIAKDAFPVDAAGACDTSKPLRYASFVSIDPLQKRVVGTVDSDDAAEAGGRPWYTPELVVLQVFTTATTWRLTAVGAKDGKKRWESELVSGALHEVGDETIYFSDATHLRALATKTGKRLEKPSVELGDGHVAELAGPHAILYRTRKAPKRIELVDLKRGATAFAFPLPEDDDPRHLRVVGRRLLYADRQNRIHALDLETRKEAWVWSGAGPGILQGVSLVGGALGFYKDGRITLLDPAGGQRIWEVKGSYRAVVPAGDQGFLAVRHPGADLVRRRRFDRPGVFFTPGETPLRYALGGDEHWSPPAMIDGLLYTLSSGGTLAAIDPAQRRVVWSEDLSKTPVSPLSPPAGRDGVLLVNLGAETQAWATSNKGRLYQARHVPLAPDRQVEQLDGLWFACAGGQPLAAYALADGRKAWESDARSVLHYALAGGTLHAVSATRYDRVEAKTGASLGTSPLPRGITAVAADGKRVILAQGPYGYGTPGPEGFVPLWKSKATDPRIAHRFKGHLALAPEGVVYAHADGAVSYWKDGAEKAEWNVTTPEFASPVLVHGGRAWFAAITVGLAGVDLAEGTFKWKSEVGDAPLFTPVLWEEKPAFWSSEGWLIPAKD